MIQAISACPTTIAEILALAEQVEHDEMRVDELVDGLVDPNADEDDDRRKLSSRRTETKTIEEDEEERRRRRARPSAEPAAAEGGRARSASPRSATCYDKMKKALDEERLRAASRICKAARGDLRRADEHPLHRASRSRRCATACAAWSRKCAATSARSWSCACDKAQHAARALHQGVSRATRPTCAGSTNEIACGASSTAQRWRATSRPSSSSSRS